eukprot:1694942-Amphidinium_carterae.1
MDSAACKGSDALTSRSPTSIRNSGPNNSTANRDKRSAEKNLSANGRDRSSFERRLEPPKLLHVTKNAIMV